MNSKRIRIISNGNASEGKIVYWMSRDQRVHDNWALLYAQERAVNENKKLIVVFCLVTEFLEATIRQYDFLLSGLKLIEKELQRYNIPFQLLVGNPDEEIVNYVVEKEAGILITDFDPLRIKRQWKEQIKKKISIPFYEVDAHNIIPCWVASDKEEFAAYTFRPKIHKQLPEFLEDFPQLKKMSPANYFSQLTNWEEIKNYLKVDVTVKKVEWIKPGEKEALQMLDNFLIKKSRLYNDERNDPTKDAQSNLSPYLHFGHICSQRVALNYTQFYNNVNTSEPFIEELIVRKELADNFCYYNINYDSYNGFRQWAKDSLDIHRKDKKEYIYSLEDFIQARTHDPLWNAAQIELIVKGKMHGYMRMYWAKKILEWTASPEEAMKIAILLNDKYELDGRDPNGYTGIAWSIGGIHDRPWFERPVFGKIRYMNYKGMAKKYKILDYVQKFLIGH